MTKEELAFTLNCRQTGDEIPYYIAQEAKSAGLVVVYGASDDLMEFEGAISEELWAHNGTTAHVTNEGLFEECESECKYSKEAKKATAPIKAIWHDGGQYSWTFETAIPHATFEILEGVEPFCQGIVFSLADASAFTVPERERGNSSVNP